MKIGYVHGFLSTFKADDEKIKELSKLGEVFPVNYDSSNPFPCIAKWKYLLHQMKNNNEDVILVGTSLGGFFAECIARTVGIPFISINSCRDADAHFYKKYLGMTLSCYYSNEKFTMDKGYINELRNEKFLRLMSKKGQGIFIFDMGDDVIDSQRTINRVKAEGYPVITFNNGSHRFEHMKELVEEYNVLIPCFN